MSEALRYRPSFIASAERQSARTRGKGEYACRTAAQQQETEVLEQI